MIEEISAAHSEFSLHKYGLRMLTVFIPENTLLAHFETRRAVLALNPRFTPYGFAQALFGCPCAMPGASDPHDIISFRCSPQLRNV
ncbi:hypothetical protein ACAX43_25270 [Paraburkholderia sp. IW21]|uniref:hypothetical protein n=1 Tax=Paraburkholderia sp. IW21 TaxID=3242488 RepID=UPI00352165C2